MRATAYIVVCAGDPSVSGHQSGHTNAIRRDTPNKVARSLREDIRVPASVPTDGWVGRLEDRRPASNGDPYKIGAVIIETTKSVC